MLESMENDRGLSNKRYLRVIAQTLENDRGLSKFERTYCEQHFLTELHLAGGLATKAKQRIELNYSLGVCSGGPSSCVFPLLGVSKASAFGQS